MSNTSIYVERVNSVEKHPNADRLDVLRVGFYQVVTQRDAYKVGDPVVYFPPDCLIPQSVADSLGVTNYLKHAIYPGDLVKSRCRVGAARIRGIPSYGFVSKVPTCVNFADVNTFYQGAHYTPPERSDGMGEAESEWATFPRYTDIQHYQRYAYDLIMGEEVVITEKIHGTNVRMGYVRDRQGQFVLAAGSKNVNRKCSPKCMYWAFMTPEIQALLKEVSGDQHNVVLYGEIFGQGVQDMTYGQDGKSFRAFDIAVDGEYWDPIMFEITCKNYNVPMVPVLYSGPVSPDIVDLCTNGESTFKVTQGFNGREGCVIKPVRPRYVGDRRVILKSVSVDYLSRSGATDLA